MQLIINGFAQGAFCVGVIAVGFLTGCAGRPSLFPNSDPALRKTSAQFAADAARRHPYKADAPRGGAADGRAEVDPVFAKLQILNSSTETWQDVDIWVNHNYVCHVPRIEKGGEHARTLDFEMLYDAKGDSFSTRRGKTPMTSVELYRDGKLYDIPLAMAD